MIQSLLIANRGEIACRIIRTARAMGIRTVAVYSDADAKALHVRSADEAVHIGPSPARESYLVGEKIIAAALAAKAEAIHPGYGFLSENAEFAQAVIDAGLIWVGPRPASITAMGLKDAAKKLMAEAGVPVTPGYIGENQDPAHLASEAAKIGYPVLIKAVAGGGGKGMRLVESAGDFADALASCQREAAASFGNAHVLIEKYIQRPRHIEVQVFGDSHGNLVHLFERDCSLQRRHQKVIEEAPAPGMDDATRSELCRAALRAAKAVDYVGAGTIEFIADASEGLRADRIWFMEMNTRLQVEHPVTEEITGVDLVEWQLRVASGEPLPLKQDEIAINGWAMEARLYAEDPAKGFLPSTGRLEMLTLPPGRIVSKDAPAPTVGFLSTGIDHGGTVGDALFHMLRASAGSADSGVEAGDVVSPFYDPMIAKIIVHSHDRQSAAEILARACEQVMVWPVKANSGFLAALLRDPEFVAGNVTTNHIAGNIGALLQTSTPDEKVTAYAANLCRSPDESIAAGMMGFRLNRDPKTTTWLDVDGELIETEIGDADNFAGSLVTWRDNSLLIVDRGWLHVYKEARSDGSGHHHAHDGDILSPMPGKIIAVEVVHGQQVTKGQKLLTLEAMKMEHTLTAPFDGTVAELTATPGAQVQVEALLARIEAGEG